MTPLVSVQALKLVLPSGQVVVEAADLEVMPGEVVALVGPSGAGKTTLLQGIFAPEQLAQQGFEVETEARSVAAEAALVPQRGALFDHLDVAANIRLAQRANDQSGPVEDWLGAVGLSEFGDGKGREVTTLSGGQAQRVAVARTLAAGRRVLILDEPAVGLDPLSVERLARMLTRQCEENEAAILLITHNLSFASQCAHRFLFLDPTERTLKPADPSWDGPGGEDAAQALRTLSKRVRRGLAKAEESAAESAGSTGKRRRAKTPGASPLLTLGSALLGLLSPRLLPERARVFAKGLLDGLVRPLLFYSVVGALLGFTIPYIISHISQDVLPRELLVRIGGTHILALTPPLSAILFGATSGSSLSAWLGSLGLNQQVRALEGLGVRPARYLWSPIWSALTLGYLVSASVFFLAMAGGGFALYQYYAVPNPWAVLLSDLLDPAPERLPYLARGAWLLFAYAVLTATISVAQGRAPKRASSDITRGMTRGVMQITLAVVLCELASVFALFSWTGQ